MPSEAEHGDQAQVREQVERREERAAHLRGLQRHLANVVCLDAQLVGLHSLGPEALHHAHTRHRLLDHGRKSGLLGLHREHRRVDPPREALGENVDQRQWREGDDREQRLRGEQHDHHRAHHCQVGCGYRDHHHEPLDLHQVARGPAHQLAGLHPVVVADVESLDVLEQLLAQQGLGVATLAEREPAAPAGERTRDQRGRGDHSRPEPQRLVAEHPPVNGDAGESGYRHLAGAPQQTHDHTGNEAPPLLAEHTTQQGPTAACRRVRLRDPHLGDTTRGLQITSSAVAIHEDTPRTRAMALIGCRGRLHVMLEQAARGDGGPRPALPERSSRFRL
ncbi:MAG: hypothetical protein FD127_143 [Acidimicrobiaceae bacterium]|nr:MAG: hypothetical protein FD127_143 [Acidimicrobiaceae bacterium]